MNKYFSIFMPYVCNDNNEFHDELLQRKRSASAATIRMPYNSNAQSSFVELVLVVDNKVFKGLGENLKKTHQRCQDIANIINAVRDIFIFTHPSKIVK